jgi:hypothetical protein
MTSTLSATSSAARAGSRSSLPLGISVFDHDVATLDVTEVTQSLTEGLAQVGASGQVGRQVAYASGLGPCWDLGVERRRKKCPGRNQEVLRALGPWSVPHVLKSKDSRKVYA